MLEIRRSGSCDGKGYNSPPTSRRLFIPVGNCEEARRVGRLRAATSFFKYSITTGECVAFDNASSTLSMNSTSPYAFSAIIFMKCHDQYPSNLWETLWHKGNQTMASIHACGAYSPWEHSSRMK